LQIVLCGRDKEGEHLLLRSSAKHVPIVVINLIGPIVQSEFKLNYDICGATLKSDRLERKEEVSKASLLVKDICDEFVKDGNGIRIYHLSLSIDGNMWVLRLELESQQIAKISSYRSLFAHGGNVDIDDK